MLERARQAQGGKACGVIMFRNSVGLLGRSLRIAQRQGTLCARAFLSDAPPTPGPRPYAAAVVPAVTWTSQGLSPRPGKIGNSADPYASLSVGEIHGLLDAAAIDYRDCFERRELVTRLQAAEPSMQPNLKSRLGYMLQRSEPLSTNAATAATPLVTNSLFMDEQYVVNLFQTARPAVVHVVSRAHTMFSNINALDIPRGSGSGFLWDSSGHVVTNYHVVQDAKRAKITLFDGQSFEAEVKGTEPDKDLAVLKITQPGRFVPISVGSSGGLQVGQKTFAIGFPLQLDQSLTAGIVSGLGRTIKSVTGRTIRDVVQTDAAINPGNSGGPLLDSRGRLIGVNTAILSNSSGVGFCIPSDTVRRVVNQIIRHGRVITPGLGMTCLPDSTPGLGMTCLPDSTAAAVLGADRHGVVIRTIVPGSGAEQVGLRGLSQDAMGNTRIGDIIVSMGSQPVVRVDDLQAAVEQFSVGDQVPLGVRRSNQVININVPLLQEVQR